MYLLACGGGVEDIERADVSHPASPGAISAGFFSLLRILVHSVSWSLSEGLGGR